MPKMKRPRETWSSDATSLAVWIVSRWITRQTPVASFSRLVTAAAAPNVTNGSITSSQLPAGPRRREAACDRDVRVLGDPQRVEPALLQRRRQFGRRDRVLGEEDRCADFHRGPPRNRVFPVRS